MTWYKTIKNNSLEQGDILIDIQVFPTLYNSDGFPKGVDVNPSNYIVLTQTCDIEQNKTNLILLAEIFSLEQMKIREPKITNNKRTMEQIKQNIHPSIALLPESLDNKDIDLEWSFVSFHNLALLDKTVLLKQIKSSNTYRLRMKSPYKENFSQLFARNAMRVALDEGLQNFPA